MKLFILAVLGLSFISCTTIITKGKVVNGDLVASEFIKIRGIGSGEFPDGTKGTGEPMMKMPDIEFDQ